jgi:hypothetical protein
MLEISCFSRGDKPLGSLSRIYGRTQIANDIAQTVKLMVITKVGMKKIIG